MPFTVTYFISVRTESGAVEASSWLAYNKRNAHVYLLEMACIVKRKIVMEKYFCSAL